MDIFVLVMVVALSAVNGANDVPKGVATLAGAGVTRIRTALIWGTLATVVGCLVSLTFASKMTKLFSKGIVSAEPTPAFAAAVLVGTASWIAFATWRSLPVSTTHALVGSLLGAGALFASDSVEWGVIMGKVVQPLLLSVLVAYAISAVLATIARAMSRRVRPPRRGGVEQAVTESRILTYLHWLTSGLTSFSRGMNDAPKIVAIGSLALLGGMTTTHLLLAVTAAMAVGGLLVGHRIGERLAKDVIKMTHEEGFTANATTATLVGLGAFQGLPMSTTQVSIGAISGTAGTNLSRLKGDTVRDFLIAWLVTPPFAAVAAAAAYLILG